ncbi:hypothetical protein GCM10010151_09070 [Actinoallomurus spadix]|uniref:Uncharacterized protein n=1 Tax=Actinoallomurus spadix TaxID=79912 RepID=A0ABN0W088_9ACTN
MISTRAPLSRMPQPFPERVRLTPAFAAGSGFVIGGGTHRTIWDRPGATEGALFPQSSTKAR